MRQRGSIATVWSALGLAFLAACSGDSSPVSAPEARSGEFATADVWTAKAYLCKLGPAGTTATFSITATGGHLLFGNEVTLDAASDPGNCSIAIWEPTDASVVTVTVTEIGATEGLVIDQIYTIGGLNDLGGIADSRTFDTAGKMASIRVDAFTRGDIKFVNVPGELPPPAAQGCTPGYWKQSQHFDSWPAAYSPNMSFDAVFADAFPGMTLLQVVSNGGGGLNALGRHSVAALLNAGNADVQNGLTTAQVIAAFNAAFASGSYEAQKNTFEGLNELGCPLS